MKTTVEYERIWYHPTYLKDKNGPGCTLLGHVYQLRRSAKGNVNIGNKTDAWYFPDETALADFIHKNRAVELPQEADGNPRYVPERVINHQKKLQAVGGSQGSSEHSGSSKLAQLTEGEQAK